MNVVLLRGVLSSTPRVRSLPSGDRLAHFEVTTTEGDRRLTVPVVLLDPPVSALRLESGADVVAAGIVRRRFFAAGGRTRSATEVVADKVVPTRHRRRAERVAEGLRAALEGFDLEPDGG